MLEVPATQPGHWFGEQLLFAAWNIWLDLGFIVHFIKQSVSNLMYLKKKYKVILAFNKQICYEFSYLCPT